MFHYFYLFIYFCAQINAIYRPKLSQIRALNYGLKNGWSKPFLIFIRVTQHFTIFSQLLLIISLFTGLNEIVCSAQILETLVLILYHTMIQRPTLLAYHEEFEYNILDIVTSYKIPNPRQRFKLFILWTMLQIQHTMGPLHLFLFKRHKHIETYISPATYLLAFYGLWSFFCWYVQGHPVYPFQKTLRRAGFLYEILFYGSVLLLCQLLNYILIYYDNL